MGGAQCDTKHSTVGAESGGNWILIYLTFRELTLHHNSSRACQLLFINVIIIIIIILLSRQVSSQMSEQTRYNSESIEPYSGNFKPTCLRQAVDEIL